MPDQRTPEEAQKILADAEEHIIQDGGVIHEESRWDAAEMALDGVSQQLIERRLQRPASARAYRSRGGWRAR